MGAIICNPNTINCGARYMHQIDKHLSTRLLNMPLSNRVTFTLSQHLQRNGIFYTNQFCCQAQQNRLQLMIHITRIRWMSIVPLIWRRAARRVMQTMAARAPRPSRYTLMRVGCCVGRKMHREKKTIHFLGIMCASFRRRGVYKNRGWCNTFLLYVFRIPSSSARVSSHHRHRIDYQMQREAHKTSCIFRGGTMYLIHHTNTNNSMDASGVCWYKAEKHYIYVAPLILLCGAM